MATSSDSRSQQLRRYLPLMRQRSWLLPVCMLIASVGALLVSQIQPRVYRATTQLVVDQQALGASSYDTVLASEQLAQSYAAMAEQPVVLQRAASQLGNTSATALASQVQISAPLALSIIQVQVDDQSPTRAAALANAVAQALIDLIQEAKQAQLKKAQLTVEQEIGQVSSQIAEINHQLVSSGAKAPSGSPSASADTQSLHQQLGAAQARLTQLQNVDAQLSAAGLVAGSSIRIFQPALPPGAPVYPKPLLNAGIGAALGFAFALSALLLLAYLDDHVRTAEDVRRLIDLPVLATMQEPLEERRDLLAAGDIGRTREPEELLTGAHGNAEDFLALCGYLTFSRSEKPVRTILVTSPTPRDGKTLAAINLAVALAQSRKRVVLVDGNLRTPAVHIGLSRSLIDADELVLEGIPFTALPAAPNLLVLKASSSACSPVELLTSGHFHRIVQSALAGMDGMPPADFVIVDSPALLAVADASLLAAQVDATLVVARAEQTRASQLVTAIEMLNWVNARIIGVALNRVGSAQGAGRYAGHSADPTQDTNATMNDTYPAKEHVVRLQKHGIADQHSE